LFLLNSFLQDCAQAQEDPNHSFHFSWLSILMEFIGWREPPNTQFPKLEPGACKATKYSNLWESNNQEKKRNNALVFHEYYMMLLQTIERTPRIDSEVVDLYHSKLEFKVDRDKTYIRPRGFRKHKEWATGLYRMNAQEVEDTIRESFDEDMKQLYDDLSAGIVTVDVPVIDPKEKGKEPIGSKRKGTEGPSAPQEKKRKKKIVTFEEPQQPIMTEDEYDLIAARIHERMQEKFDAIQLSQERQLAELKAITEKTATMQLQPATAVRGGSAQGPSREEVLAKGRTNIVHIPPGSIKFPVSLVGMQGQIVHPLEVNLSEVPMEQLREIFQ
jgi:hypothetical protein